MSDTQELIREITETCQEEFHRSQSVLSFEGYLSLLKARPKQMIRNAPEYIHDTFKHYGDYKVGEDSWSLRRWKLFDMGTERQVPIIGAEMVQDDIFKSLRSFVQQGMANKLIVLHGPNGSAKTSIVDAIANAMHKYSETDEGAVYRFSWIFPTDKSSTPRQSGDGPIGFGSRDEERSSSHKTYAFIDESKIASKIHSEFRENPVFLIPMPQREQWLRQWIADQRGINPEDVNLPPHVLLPGLSKRNRQIYEQLLTAYDGDLSMVLRHVQVERFIYSKQYREGISTVEPQMSIDAGEKQLTIDKNIANMPSVLQNISFHEAVGPLIEANRGLLEFSDLLKRPVEAYKYLLSTVEKGTLNLASSTANLDIVFFATTNEKHLDGFKTVADFASFRSRFDLVTAPYLLQVSQEEQIYEKDVTALNHLKKIAPHSVHLLSLWAVLTRLKQPNPESYPGKHRSLIARLGPLDKMLLYEGKPLRDSFKVAEQATLKKLKGKILEESRDTVVYEGRFGASPREVKALLYRANQNPAHETLTPMCVFEELERLVKDRSIYEFLQLEPRGRYHQPAEFIKILKDEFCRVFEEEATSSMTLVEEEQYDILLNRYIDHVVATVKKERIFNPITGGYDTPSEELMKRVEKILNVSGAVERHREGLLGRIAAYRIDHPNEDINVAVVFESYMTALRNHYYNERNKIVQENFKAMLTLGTPDETNLTSEERELATTTTNNLESKFGYDPVSTRECLKFLLTHKKK